MIRTEAVLRPRQAIVPILAFLAVTSTSTVAVAAGGNVHACEPQKIEIVAGLEKRTFSIEVADDPKQQAQGLMFRPSLPANAGMLFVFDPPRQAKFWMRNTMIPLDMIFIDDTGRVESIAERNDPYSERVSSSQADVRAVLEINGGQSRQLGIEPGAQEVHRLFEKAPDGMRCQK
jgi:uncharacterized membrane protein (UPF0127 family)